MATLAKTDYAKVWALAKAAGEAAAAAAVPEPIIVYDANLDGSPREGGKKWYSSYGLCGFATIHIKPATSGFAKWLKATERSAYKGYYGGLDLFVHPEHGRGTPLTQSIDVKVAYAKAAVAVLVAHGIPATYSSRLD